MKPRPKFRTTVRVKNAELFYNDRAHDRFVVYRRAGGIERKTSVRYGYSRGYFTAEEIAYNYSRRLRSWPAEKLAQFKF